MARLLAILLIVAAPVFAQEHAELDKLVRQAGDALVEVGVLLRQHRCCNDQEDRQ